MLDAVSALLLTEQGVDVGLAKGQDLRASLCKLSPNRLLGAGEEIDVLIRADATYLTADLAKTATVLLSVRAGDKTLPLCYTYENAKGQRFLVWLFHSADIKRDSDLTEGYLIQKAMATGVEWVAKAPLPAHCAGHPKLYMLCSESENALTVGLFNCFADAIPAPTVTLSGSYRTLESFRGSGTLHGNTVTLSPLPAFSFTAFTVTK